MARGFLEGEGFLFVFILFSMFSERDEEEWFHQARTLVSDRADVKNAMMTSSGPVSRRACGAVASTPRLQCGSSVSPVSTLRLRRDCQKRAEGTEGDLDAAPDMPDWSEP